MLDDYLNRDARLFLERMPETQREWVGLVIAELRKRYPAADHWTTGGEGFKYTDIRIGGKAKKLSKGKPVFYIRLHRGKGPVSLVVNPSALQNDAEARLLFDQAPALQDVKEWLDGYELTDRGYTKLEGDGLRPADYPEWDGEDEDAGPDDEGDVPVSQDEEGPAQALNRILYGPPGTGKTYRTVSEALRIIEDTAEPDGDYAAQKKRFDALRREGRIAFVTFHQSFSYEDFIEGIRADTIEGQLSYSVRDGVFKKMAISAMYRPPVPLERQAEPDFDDVFEAFLKKVGNELPYQLQSASGGELLVQSINDADTLRVTHAGRTAVYGVTRNRLKALYEAYPTQAALAQKSTVNAITEVIGGANSTVYWGALKRLLQFRDDSRQKLTPAPEEKLSPVELTEYEQIKRRVLGDDTLAPNGKRYVLIIDEINRGNMSRVFGELITLIEPAKRAGRFETAEVQLPYSGDRFSVPSNLYLIGTMNTADRSLAVVDTALRRRFDFIEMIPDPDALKQDVVQGVKIKLMLRAINMRIEHLYDREHTIGHSFFMGLTARSTLSDLALIFKNNVLPLLEEYFFEDWEKIDKILGKSRVYEPQSTTTLGFAPTGKTWRRRLERLDKAATYQAIYEQAAADPAPETAPAAADDTDG
jgi:5-methylcytosine-specific restriction protein B